MEHMAFAVRRATVEDCPGIYRCLRAAFAPYREQYTARVFEDTVPALEKVQERIAAMSLFVAVDLAGAIVGTIGCASVSEEEGHLRGMAVDPRFQGAGVASELLERATAELAGQGCVRVTLDTTEPLRRAVRFYERNGFSATGKVMDFFGMPLLEYIKMLKA